MMMSFFQGTGSFEENRSKNLDNWDLQSFEKRALRFGYLENFIKHNR